MFTKLIRIGSRGSELALRQAIFLKSELEKLGLESEIIVIKTQGDIIQNVNLEKLEGKGFFVKEIEEALLNGSVDVAVHSHKDLPTEPTQGLILAAVSEREDPAELLIIRKEYVDEKQLFDLKINSVVGTSSSRRSVQMQLFRPDIYSISIRGNVMTRVEKLRRREFDAIMLASAGIRRLGANLDDFHVVRIPPQKIIPAPAQGVLAFQCRENDSEMREILSRINNLDSEKCIAVERKLMNLFNGGCHLPFGAFCEFRNNEFHVWTTLFDAEKKSVRRIYKSSATNTDLAREIFDLYNNKPDKKILVTTHADRKDVFIRMLENQGFSVEATPFVQHEKITINEIPATDWLFFSSRTAVHYFFEQKAELAKNIKIAAIGNETAQEIKKYGHRVDFIGDGNSETIAVAFELLASRKNIVFPAAKNHHRKLFDLVNQYANCRHVPVYDNVAFGAMQTSADIIAFTSPMNIDGFLMCNNIQPHQKIIAIGETTKAHCIERGIQNVITAPEHSLLSIADVICGLSFRETGMATGNSTS